MHRVSELKLGGACATRVWLSEKAQAEIRAYRKKHDPHGAFLKRMQRYAQTGFGTFEGDRGCPIRHEGNGVYRVAPTGDLFRIIGFYENNARRDYIGIDAFLKTGRELTAAQRDRIRAVAKVYRDHDWERVDDGDPQ